MGRISIAGILGLVAALAFGLAALVVASNAWLGAAFMLTVGLLFASVLGVLFRGWRQGRWLGFALFGWGYILLGHVPGLGFYDTQRLLPDVAVEWIFEKANPYPVPPPRLNPQVPTVSASSPVPVLVLPAEPTITPEEAAYQAAAIMHGVRSANAGRIGYWLSIQVFGLVGALVGTLFARGRRSGDPAPAAP